MPCYSPLTGWRSRQLSANGRRPVVFDVNHGYKDLEVKVPCGQCIGCRLAKSRKWAIRIMNEAQCWPENSFITLTYDDEHLPYDWSLDKRHLELFWKSFRKAVLPSQIRYYACGEYGDQSGRPHYHAIVFNYGFPDRVLYSEDEGIRLYESKLLNSVWKKGICTVGDVSFESAAYVARYVVKKQLGRDAPDHYTHVDERTGEIYKVQPEFANMSRRPGIGKEFFEKYKDEIIRDNFLISQGRKVEVPEYYDKLVERHCEETYQRMKGRRRMKAKENADNNTGDRLAVREHVKKAQVNFLKRKL